jgi:hypothetical protein
LTFDPFFGTTSVVSVLFEKFDSAQFQKEREIEQQVEKEIPSEREAQTLAREVFLTLLARSGGLADRRNVEEAWRQTKIVVQVYLEHAGEIRPLHTRNKQQKIRARLLLA